MAGSRQPEPCRRRSHRLAATRAHTRPRRAPPALTPAWTTWRMRCCTAPSASPSGRRRGRRGCRARHVAAGPARMPTAPDCTASSELPGNISSASVVSHDALIKPWFVSRQTPSPLSPPSNPSHSCSPEPLGTRVTVKTSSFPYPPPPPPRNERIDVIYLEMYPNTPRIAHKYSDSLLQSNSFSFGPANPIKRCDVHAR